MEPLWSWYDWPRETHNLVTIPNIQPGHKGADKRAADEAEWQLTNEYVHWKKKTKETKVLL